MLCGMRPIRDAEIVQDPSKSKVHWYRERAADCLALAERAPEMAKATFADMAADWLRLAELSEQWQTRYRCVGEPNAPEIFEREAPRH
jgi:hypothetical protein